MERGPHTQEDVEDVVVDILQHGKVMSTQEVTAAVKRRLYLAPADLQRAKKRENESKIDQIIANSLQANRRLCREGLIERTGRGEFRITPFGKKYLEDRAAEVADMSALLDELLSNQRPG